MSSTQIDSGTAYSLKPGTHDARLTEVGRGTPMGELMRRYWHPVGLFEDATDLPRKVRVLGEDLILFRDGKGRPGLMHPRCCHRGTSLFYGRIEDEGIRCCYHGWMFDVQGRVLERPAEPNSGPVKAIRQPWYPVEDRYGLIWAYMGPPEKKPLLPRYNVFENLDEGEQLFTDDRNIGIGGVEDEAPCNWLQHYENIHDPAHFLWLHYIHSGPQFGDRFGEVSDLAELQRGLPAFTAGPNYSITERGLTASRTQTLPDGRRLTNVVETALPTLRVVPNPFGKPGRVDQIGWVLPTDDTHIKIYTVLRATDRSYFEIFEKNRQKWPEGRPMEQRQRFPNDYEAQTSQGPITHHSEEHLARSDKAIVMLRRLYEEQIAAVEQGRDPIGVRFAPDSDLIDIEGGTFFAAIETA